MTLNEQDRCLGAAVRQLWEKQRILTCLKLKAEEVARCLDLVAGVLRGGSHGDFVDGTFYERRAPDKTSVPIAEAVWHDAADLEALIQQIRTTEQEIAFLEKRTAVFTREPPQ